MKTVSIITTNSRIPNFFSMPLKACRHPLKACGYDIRIRYRSKKKNLEADILGLASNFFSGWWHRPETVFAFIDDARKYANKIVWLDDNDSTSVTHFELLPVIDLYLKKQLLKDKTRYTKPLYGDRVFTDYYHRRFGICDDTPYQSAPLDLQYASKVHLSWHIGLGDMVGDILPRAVKFVKNMLPVRYPRGFIPPGRDKPIDVMFRGSRNYARRTVAFHRQRIGELLDAATQFRRALNGRVPISRYQAESRDTKIMVSPFGWGEIGVRDFECWYYGAALMKPDMSHMETWPDVFVPHKTYLPIKWDFSNLISGIEDLLADGARRRALAEAGQAAYREMTSARGMDAFCRWFTRQIER